MSYQDHLVEVARVKLEGIYTADGKFKIPFSSEVKNQSLNYTEWEELWKHKQNMKQS